MTDRLPVYPFEQEKESIMKVRIVKKPKTQDQSKIAIVGAV